MSTLPSNPSADFRRLNPHLYPALPRHSPQDASEGSGRHKVTPPQGKRAKPPTLNVMEARYRDHLKAEGFDIILEQAITLRLDPPYKSYRPDLACFNNDAKLMFFEVKGPHRFREKGIAKAALAAKTYPMFRFILADWVNKQWKETVL